MGFFSRLRAAAFGGDDDDGDAGDRSPWGSFWFSPLGGRKGNGSIRVTDSSAMTISAVYRAVSLISGHLSMMPIHVHEDGIGGARVLGHKIEKLFKSPCGDMDGMFFRQFLTACLLLRGNAYCWIESSPWGEVLSLTPIHPDNVQPEKVKGTMRLRYRVTDDDGHQQTYTSADIWHIKGFSLDGLVGLSVIAVARESMAGNLAAQAYAERYFQNDARPHSGAIELPATFKFADDEARKKYRANIQRNQTGKNRGKIMVLEGGAQYKDIAVSNADAQFLESRKFGIEEVARWFGVPPHMIGSLDKATFSNIVQQTQDYINNTLLYWCRRFEESISWAFIQDEKIVRLYLNEILRGDIKTRYDAYRVGIIGGFLSPNEARADDGRAPLAGGDTLWRPKNITDPENPEADDKKPPPPDNQEDQ